MPSDKSLYFFDFSINFYFLLISAIYSHFISSVMALDKEMPDLLASCIRNISCPMTQLFCFVSYPSSRVLPIVLFSKIPVFNALCNLVLITG